MRYLVIDALISYKKVGEGQIELASVVVQLHDLIMALNNQRIVQKLETTLPNSFMTAMKNSVKGGVSSG